MNLAGNIFNGPFDPGQGFTRDFGAVYAIIDGIPKVLDVGQTESINGRFPNHDRKDCWDINKSGNIQLYVLENSSEQTRLQIEQTIRNTYNPACGIR